MKRILIEGMSCMMGGMETFILTLYRNMDQKCFHFDFITYDSQIPYENELKRAGSIIYKVTPRSKNFFQYKQELNMIFRKRKYDIFWSNRTTLSSIQSFKAASKYKVPIIICHSHQSKNMGTLFTLAMHKVNQRLVGRYINLKAACSEVAAEWFFGKQKDVIILKNSVDIDLYDYNKERALRLRNEYSVENKFLIGHVGRFATEKNHIFLIEIFEKVLEKEPNAILWLCGEGEKRKEIESLVKEKRLESKVEFLGVRKDVVKLLQMMDVMVFPSLFEGLPFVLVEAQAAALPCIVSDRVSYESKLTDVLDFVPLDQNAEYWADRVLYSKKKERYSTKEQMLSSGYTIPNLMEQVHKYILN